MLKRLAIGFIALAIVVPGQPNQTASEKEQPTGQSQPAVTGAHGVNKQSDSETNEPKPGSDSPSRNTPVERSHWWSKSDWWLLLVASLTGGVIGWQSWETRKSANASRDAAQAALLNAQAFINKERSRIFVRGEFTGHLEITIYAENRGESPARFTFGFFDLEVFPDSVGFARVFDYTQGGIDLDFPPGNWLAPKAEHAIAYCDQEGISDLKGKEVLDAVSSGRLRLWLFGTAQYWDGVSNSTHETRFCMACIVTEDGGSVYERGPEEYRTQT